MCVCVCKTQGAHELIKSAKATWKSHIYTALGGKGAEAHRFMFTTLIMRPSVAYACIAWLMRCGVCAKCMCVCVCLSDQMAMYTTRCECVCVAAQMRVNVQVYMCVKCAFPRKTQVSFLSSLVGPCVDVQLPSKIVQSASRLCCIRVMYSFSM